MWDKARDVITILLVPALGWVLMVENGMVYVDNEANGAGIICPLPHDQETRLAGSLVMVHIR